MDNALDKTQFEKTYMNQNGNRYSHQQFHPKFAAYNRKMLLKRNQFESPKNHRKKGRRKRRATPGSELVALARDFVGHKLSAAGIPYVVTSPSRYRRYLWCLAVLATLAFMGYMTFNVIKEYLSYPKMMKREDKMQTKMIFPAVTVCALNRIANNRINDTSIAGLQQLKDLLDNRSNLFPSDTERAARCYKNPMCQWMWFNETCACAKNPCDTELCSHNEDDSCSCSHVFCNFDGNSTNLQNACGNSTSTDDLTNNSTSCICKTDVTLSTTIADVARNASREKFNKELLNLIRNPKIRRTLKLIEKSKLNDFLDIEEELMTSLEDINNYGIDFDNLIISCSFEGQECDRGNFTVLYNAKYGKCYMFNYAGSTGTMVQPLSIHNYGSNSGLQLILLIEGHESVDLVSREIGARVTLHDPKDLPFVTEKGMNIRPHDMTAIEVSTSETFRLGPPWGVCMDEARKKTLNFPYGREEYSLLGCEKACRNEHLKKKCNCTRRQLMEGRTVMELPDKKRLFCKLSNTTETACIERALDEIEDGVMSCGCIPPCHERVYHTSVTSSLLNEAFFRSVKAIQTLRVTDRDEQKPRNGFNVSHVDTNNSDEILVGLKVYYSTFQITTDTEIASYSWETLVANVGGNLGFFLGLSLVTFFEVAEFLWDIFCTMLNMLCFRRTRVHGTYGRNRCPRSNFFSCGEKKSKIHRRSSF